MNTSNRKPTNPLPTEILAILLDGISRSTTPELLEQTRQDLAASRDQLPDCDWRPVYRAFSQRKNELEETACSTC